MELQIQKLQGEAIAAASAGNWQKAISLNTEILTLHPFNADAHLALGFAYMQTNKYELSIKHYKKALFIEPGNPIAKNNLDKLNVLKKKTHGATQKENHKNPKLKGFINVLGKTKTIELINIGQSEILAKLDVGELVELKQKKRRLEVRTTNNEYIGALPDDISKRLLFLIEASSVYKCYIKSALKNAVELFIVEYKKGKKVRQFASFPKNIHDDLKSMMQSLQKDEENADGSDDEDSEHGHQNINDLHEDKVSPSDTEDDNDEIIDLDKLAENIDDDQHDDYMTDLSAYDEGEEESEE